jgi:hypothetical protein
MIVYDLECRSGGHRFEGWFGSSADFDSQSERGLLSCPTCGSADIAKAVMAPAVPRKGNQLPEPAREGKPAKAPMAAGGPPIPPQVAEMLRAYATAQAEALKSSTWVGEGFPEQARAMHYGEEEQAPIHGQASLEDARDLIEEGIAVAPVLFPVIPPDKAN